MSEIYVELHHRRGKYSTVHRHWNYVPRVGDFVSVREWIETLKKLEGETIDGENVADQLWRVQYIVWYDTPLLVPNDVMQHLEITLE